MALGGLKRVDFYRHVPVDLTEPTAPGAIISIVAMTIMVLLFFGEVRSYFNPPSRSDMYVAPDEGHGSRLKVVFNMTFHKLPCFVCSMDILDVLGRHEINVFGNARKTRVSPDGKFLNQFHDLNQGEEDEHLFSSMSQEGCNLEGFVMVHKVPGNFHVSAHGLQHLVTKYLQRDINVQHTIHHLHFGETELHDMGKHNYEGEVTPLDGETHRDDSILHYEYFLDIVPTVYTYRMRRRGVGVDRGYQFTSNMHKMPNPPGHMASVFFQYQLSPITVSYSFESSSFSHMLTYMCAIIGGVFTVAGIISRMVHTSVTQMQRRLRGKDQ